MDVGLQEALQHWDGKSTVQLCMKLICISAVLGGLF